jgi:hypothetical protein
MQTFTEEIAEKISVDLHLCELIDILDVEDSDIDGLDLSSPHKHVLKKRRDDLRKRRLKGMLWWPTVLGRNRLSTPEL